MRTSMKDGVGRRGGTLLEMLPRNAEDVEGFDNELLPKEVRRGV